jgi:colanic acid biosynthesis glycosyl transferase WcaI
MKSKRRKVVFLNRYFYPDISATSQMLSDVAFHLVQQHVAVHVVTSRQRYDNAGANLPDLTVINGVRVSRVWSTRFGRGWLPGRALDYLTFYLSAAVRLRRLVHRGDIVVAKTDPPMISFVAYFIARLKRAVLVNWVQDVFPDVARVLNLVNGMQARVLGRMRDITLTHAKLNIVPGECMQRVLLSKMPIRPSSMRIIHNWADGTRLRDVPSAANTLRHAWSLEGKFVVGYSGNMGRVHEFGTLLQAAERMRGRTDVAFLFIGDGARRAEIELWVADKQLGNVIIKPYQQPDVLANSLTVPDVHIVSLLPAVEGLCVPSKLYGIMASGRPVIFIGDPNGEVAKIIREAACGMTVVPGDVNSLVAALEKLCGNPILREEQSRNARGAFDHKFDKPHAMSAWTGAINELLKYEARA